MGKAAEIKNNMIKVRCLGVPGYRAAIEKGKVYEAYKRFGKYVIYSDVWESEVGGDPKYFEEVLDDTPIDYYFPRN